MRRLNRTECPNTRVEFINKWNTDYVFRARAKGMGFAVLFDNVIFPNGKVATPRVKQSHGEEIPQTSVLSVVVTHTTFNRGNMGSSPIERTHYRICVLSFLRKATLPSGQPFCYPIR